MSQENAKASTNSIVWAPRVGSSYSNGWQQLKKYFLELLLITVIGIVIAAPFGIFRDDVDTN